METLPEGQVTVYSDSQFRGKSESYGAANGQIIESPNSNGLRSVGNDAISSIKVGKGVKLELYADSGFRGGKLTLLEGNYPQLLDWNDKITGFRMKKVDPEMNPVVMFYVDNNKDDQNANRQGLSVGEYQDSNQLLKNDSFTLIDIPEGVDVTVYEHGNFGGYSQTFSKKGLIRLSEYGLNDKISSVRITSQEFALTDLKFSNGRIISADAEETIATKATTSNESSGATVNTKLSIQKSISASVTVAHERSHSFTVSAKTTQKFGTNIPGMLNSSIEVELLASTQHIFVERESKTETVEQRVTYEVTVSVPANSQIIGDLIVTPVVKQYDVTSVFSRVDKEGNIIPNGDVREEKSKVTLKYATDAQIVVRDVKKVA